MSLIHPAFSAIPHPEASEALSAPFVKPNEYTVFNGEYTFSFAAEEMVPLVVGGMMLRGEEYRFMAGLSQHSTTPLHHMVRYLDNYGAQVGKAQAPIFEEFGRADGSADLDMITAMQDKIIKIAQEDKVRVVSGFVLGLVREPQVMIAGLVISTKVLEAMHQVVEEGFVMVEPVFEGAYAEEAEDYGGRESMREGLVDTVRALMIPTSAGRLLPELQVVKNGLIEASPKLGEFYAKPRKDQRKALAAERMAASNFN